MRRLLARVNIGSIKSFIERGTEKNAPGEENRQQGVDGSKIR